MAIPRIWVAQESDDVQALRVDSSSRYIQVNENYWQPLFQFEAELTLPTKRLKLAAELDYETFSKLRIIGYLYNETTNSIDSVSSVSFRLHTATGSGSWQDTFEVEIAGVEQFNSYYFAEVDITDLSSGIYDGSATIMIDGVATRLSDTYRDRIYVNHLGIYDSHTRLKKFVDFLDLTKLDE
jgi:hypothetical protein